MSNLASRPKRILISAYACAPERGAEPGVGWNLIRECKGFVGFMWTCLNGFLQGKEERGG